MSCISYDCYKAFTQKTRINMNTETTVISEDGSNLGPIEVVIYSLILGANKFEHKFKVC